jgi:molybdenum cofactor synthesis domain-containing protein
MKKVPVEEAVGLQICHDITKVVPGREKYRAYRRGQLITPADIPQLLGMGKEHIYVWEPEDNLVHEDEAAIRLAGRAAGKGLELTEPSQGRVNLCAQYDGLLKVNVNRLNWINNLENIILATMHNNRPVVKGQTVAGTRVIPLAIERHILEEAEKLASDPEPLMAIMPFEPLWVGIVTTGSEVYNGQIKDGFGKLIRKKVAPFGGRIMGQVIVPDNPEIIAREIQNYIAEGAELVVVTGGMSVDPDDVTPLGIRATGSEVVFYGAPALPGSQNMLAYRGHVPICGVPAGALYSRTTTFDLLLPRIFAGDRISRADIAALGHGGLCEECKVCHYPLCPFGKSIGI